MVQRGRNATPEKLDWHPRGLKISKSTKLCVLPDARVADDRRESREKFRVDSPKGFARQNWTNGRSLRIFTSGLRFSWQTLFKRGIPLDDVVADRDDVGADDQCAATGRP